MFRVCKTSECLLITCLCYNRWVLWYYKSDKSKDWMDNLKQIVSFDTVSYSDYTMVTQLFTCSHSHRLKISGGKYVWVCLCVICGNPQ